MKKSAALLIMILLVMPLFSFKSLAQTEAQLPRWLLFYQLVDTDNLSAVIWTSGEKEEDFKQHAIMVRIPEWVQESGGRLIESKSSDTTFNYFWLPHGFKAFCQSYEVDSAKIRRADGTSIIDLGKFSDQFEPVDPELLKAVDARIATWFREEDWIVHPRPEPQPPKWLNQPLNRKFYYEIRD